jgi:hypothetical protein
MSDSLSVDDALASFREMAATDGACEDCLVPLPIMTNIMARALAPTAYELDHVELPGAVH